MPVTQPILSAVPSIPAPAAPAIAPSGGAFGLSATNYHRAQGGAAVVIGALAWRYALKPGGVWAVNKVQSLFAKKPATV